MILPLAFPAVVAGSIFTFSLTLGDYITPSLVSPDTQFIGNVVFSQPHQQPAAGLGLRHGADRGDGHLPADRHGGSAPSSTCMTFSRNTRNLLRVGGRRPRLAFIYIPLLVIAIYAFNGGTSLKWPPPSLTTQWFGQAIDNPGARHALLTSVEVGLVATADRPRARHARVVRGVPPQLLRPRDGLLSRDHPDRPARDRHGIGAEQHLHPGPRRPAQPAHGDRRTRHLLHRRRLQQRDRQAAASLGEHGGGVGGSRRAHLADLPPHHPAQHADGPGGGGAARLRALIRRDHRHQVHHRRRRGDPADLDLQQPLPAPATCPSSTWWRCWWS